MHKHDIRRQSVGVRLATFAHAMLTIISLYLLYVSLTLAMLIRPTPPKLLEPSLLTTSASSPIGFSNFQCFDPTFPPPNPSYPILYQGCIDAADSMLSNVQRNVSSIFSRSEDADIRLPWGIRRGNCLINLDVLNEGDEEIMSVQDAHEIAIALCRICVSGYYKYGGRTPVGPRGVVYISVYGTTPITVETMGPAASGPSHVIAKRIGHRLESRSPLALKPLLLAPESNSNLSISNANKADCSSKPDPSSRMLLKPPRSLDCINAADEMLKIRPVHLEMRFGRGPDAGFRLPWSARSESCIVTIDTRNDNDFDTLTLFNVHRTAVDQIRGCTMGGNPVFGFRAVGPRNIVYVYVFGLRMPEIGLSAAGHVVV